MYAILVDNAISNYPLSLPDLRGLFPDVSFAYEPSDSDLANFGIVSVLPNPNMPTHNPYIERLVQGTPILIEGKWYEYWEVQAIPAEEIAARVIAQRAYMTCTPRQARLALLAANLLDTVEAWIAAQSRSVQIEWATAQEIKRNWPLLVDAGVALGLNNEALDGLFAAAKQY